MGKWINRVARLMTLHQQARKMNITFETVIERLSGKKDNFLGVQK
jgi:hypothetical protein